jgi:hypothetical protein
LIVIASRTVRANAQPDDRLRSLAMTRQSPIYIGCTAPNSMTCEVIDFHAPES